MAKSKKNTNNSIYRFMCLRSIKGTNYHTDFSTKEAALEYIKELNDKTLEWYGLYEVNIQSDRLYLIESKRIKW